MAKVRSVRPEDFPPSMLTVPTTDAVNAISDRIALGVKLRDTVINTESELENLTGDYKIWDEYNRDLILKLFTSTEQSREYGTFARTWFCTRNSLKEKVDDQVYDFKVKLGRLESLKGRIPLFASPASTEPVINSAGRDLETVFIVHGRDVRYKLEVARFLESMELKPIILHEQPSEGSTVPEKLERYSTVGFAVVLLTPDDTGCLKDEYFKEAAKPRARQNVIFELGYFIGKLGRNRVCALFTGDVELPTDYLGTLYIPLDDAGAWKLSMAREMRTCGLRVDLNKAI